MILRNLLYFNILDCSFDFDLRFWWIIIDIYFQYVQRFESKTILLRWRILRWEWLFSSGFYHSKVILLQDNHFQCLFARNIEFLKSFTFKYISTKDRKCNLCRIIWMNIQLLILDILYKIKNNIKKNFSYI